MISQADIIRALVHKNCTDESIMSVVLSPDCTPPKLLEKFNEAERFDLALDVSMKLGLDVSPIWRTWAMRCLKNQNFQAAREKFRHCFQRLRSSAGRGSPACNNLLCDILNELIPMDESRLPLSEQIDLIKDRTKHDKPTSNLNGTCPRDPSTMKKRPKILAESLHYIREYGTIEDHVRFFIRTSLWQEAVKLLLDYREKINAERFFIVDVVLRVASRGRLDDVLAALIEQDPAIELASKYIKAMYNHYTVHKRFNSLCYLQHRIGDFVAAAEIQISNFYLKKPTASYKDLNARVARLVDASENYRCYVNRLERVKSGTCDGETPVVYNSPLFTHIPLEEAISRLRTMETQIEITRNFAINEVQGCINNVEIVCGKSSSSAQCEDQENTPVTLFDRGERRMTYLAALILIYFDLDCTAYFSTSGLNLANRLIQEHELDKRSVFKTAMRIIIEDESCDLMDNANLLLKRLTEDHLAQSKRSKLVNSTRARRKSSKPSVIREVAHIVENDFFASKTTDTDSSSPSSTHSVINKSTSASQYHASPNSFQVTQDTRESARTICDDVICDSIRSCREPDYKMKLATLLSPENKIGLYIELGKLSNAQRLAFDMNRRDYVELVFKEAERLSQDHIKDVCQHWLAKH